MADATTFDHAIRTSGLRMIYNPGLFQRRKLALEGLDLEVPEGSVYGFLGQNGAGKTTTIKTLVGLQMPTAGRAWIRGIDFRDPQSRSKIGFMPENPYFYEYLTAWETLSFYGQLSGVPRADRRKKIDELLEVFSLEHARDTRMRDFSKGMRQRLGLAQAIIHNPPVVILDEPMTGLDPLGRRDIRNVILRLRDRLCTVFFSSHILSDVAEICDQVCVIHQGKKVADGPIHSLLSSKVVEVRIAASGIGKEGLDDEAGVIRRSWHDGALYHALVNDEEAAEKVKAQIEKAGGTLRVLEPHFESLEQYFVRVTEGTGRESGNMKTGEPEPADEGEASIGSKQESTGAGEDHP